MCVALFSNGTGPIPELSTTVGLLPAWQSWTVLALVAVIGLRDKIIFLAARGEVYAPFVAAFLFGGANIIVAAKLVCLVIWMGAATSKLTKHFPFVISTMMSNSPVVRPRAMNAPSSNTSRMIFVRDRCRGRWLAERAIEGLVPLVLFFSRGLADRHRGIRHGLLPSRHPVGHPDGGAAGVERVHDLLRAVPLRRPRRHRPVGMTNPLPVILFLLMAEVVVTGNLFPQKISFLPGMRYYAGNWDTTLWCLTPSAEAKIDKGIVAIANMPAAQLEKF